MSNNPGQTGTATTGTPFLDPPGSSPSNRNPPPPWLTIWLAGTYGAAVGGSLAWAWVTHQAFSTWLTTWAPSVTGVILAVVGFYYGQKSESGQR
jgi:uncharacterized membrane protein YeaQ/YmgE (transglycosylase-associated protein family)